MFGWFKNKAGNIPRGEAEVGKIVNPAPASVEPLTQDDIRTIFELCFKENAHASLFYAQCAGMREGVLGGGNFEIFVEKVLRVEPSEFSEEDIRRAAEYRLGEFFDALLSDTWELSLGIISTEEHSQRFFKESGMPSELLKDPSSLAVGENASFRGVVSEIRERASRLKVRKPYQDLFSDVDISGVALSVCLSRKDADYQKLQAALDEKFEVLRPIFSRLRNSLTNKYGDYDSGPMIAELGDFIEYSFEDSDFDFYYSIKPLAKLLNYIERRLDESLPEDMPLDGVEFEHWCAEQIRCQGWSASVSRASGDQGVDVLVKRDGVQVAVQCKRYSSPVGNKAVQEAFTGMKFSGSGFACVISTGGFTRSARQAAAATDVWLLDATEISVFSEHYGFEAELEKPSEDVILSPIEFSFETLAECSLGGLLRSSLSSAPIDDLGISGSVVAAVLSNVDSDSGAGQFECSVLDAGRLIVLVEMSLCGEMKMTEKNLAALGSSELYDGVALSAASLGGSVPVWKLYSPERLNEIDRCIDGYIDHMPEALAILTREHSQAQRAVRAG